MRQLFRNFACAAAAVCGAPWTFFVAVGVVIVWALTGPIFHYSDTWQLVINTGTTIITFLMVFLIQATQNRDTTAMHLKLDELLRAVNKARNELVDIESAPEEKIEELKQEFHDLRDTVVAPRAAGVKNGRT